MIVVDASALLAVHLGEPEREEFLAILNARSCVMSPVNHWEALAKAHKLLGEPGVTGLEQLIDDLSVRVVPLSVEDSRRAHRAFIRFGKGVGGPLNLGDCFAYALADREGEGLLFKGDDFPRTDVVPAA